MVSQTLVGDPIRLAVKVWGFHATRRRDVPELLAHRIVVIQQYAIVDLQTVYPYVDDLTDFVQQSYFAPTSRSRCVASKIGTGLQGPWYGELVTNRLREGRPMSKEDGTMERVRTTEILAGQDNTFSLANLDIAQNIDERG